MTMTHTMECVESEARREAVGSIEGAIGRLIRTVRTTLSENASAFSAELRPSAYAIMSVIQAMHPVAPSAIIDATGFDKSSVSRQLRILKDAGYITSSPATEDRRADLFSPTAEAGERFAAIRSGNRERFSASFDAWSEEEIVRFAQLLDKFIVREDEQ
jgi:DNA-binding MarR family transcriptional regulator